MGPVLTPTYRHWSRPTAVGQTRSIVGLAFEAHVMAAPATCIRFIYYAFDAGRKVYGERICNGRVSVRPSPV